MMKENRYSYYSTFNIQSESDLDDFWSFVIFRLNVHNEKSIYDRFARFYNLLLEHNFSSNHYVTLMLYETSNDFLLDVETNVEGIVDKMIYKLDYYQFDYHLEDDSLVYSIAKKEALKTTVDKLPQKVSKELKVYDFIGKDDLDDLTNILEKMIDRDYAQITSILDTAELNDYKTTFSYFASISQPYRELTVISNIVAELSVILSLYVYECLEHPYEVRAFFRAFVLSLETWLEMLFKVGCEMPSFMNDSFLADLAQFKMLLGLYDDMNEDEEAENLDAVFDF